MPNGTFGLECTFLSESAKAILVEYEGQEMWIPKSQFDWETFMNEYHQSGDEVEIEIPEWLAIEKGFL